MKFLVGDLVTLKDTVIRDLRVIAIGIVVDFWPVEHSKHGYIYNIVSAQFGRTRRDLPEDDFELLNKIVEKKVDSGSLL